MVFTCDSEGVSKTLSHFWKHTVGSDHAIMALRADWQKQLLRCHTELGFKYVRFHGILCDDMSTVVCEKGQLIYSFFNADQICDYLLSIGMRPFIELSFMPDALSSGDKTVFHYKGNITPPEDYDQWDALIYKLVDHLVARYGIAEVSNWFFEVWNEPNLPAFWTGSQADYFRLYQHTATAIKKVHPKLQVGGPATADNCWITDFLDFCKQNRVPVDFTTTHHYPNDNFGQPGDDTIAQLAASGRSALREQAAATKKLVGDKPLYYTEWSSSSNPFDDLHDMPYAAAFIIKTIMEAHGYVNGYSYWVFSDIFEENYFSSAPYHGGFGLTNIYGIPKPAYRAYQLLAGLGDEFFDVSGSHETVDVWITRKSGTVKILITNFGLPAHPLKTETVSIKLSNVNKVLSCFIERIDDDHANARRAWVEMGQPGSLTPSQVTALELASSLIKEDVEFKYGQDFILIEADMPPQGSACITVEMS